MPSTSAAREIPSIACASSCAIAGFSGFPKLRQSVRPIGSPPAPATVGRAARGALDTGGKRGGLAGRRALQRNREPAQRRPQAQDGRVETRTADGARADEVVVLLD